MAHTMLYYRVKPIDDGGDDLLIPHQEAAITGIGIEHETHPHIVAFALHTINASPLTPEAYPFRLAHADAVHRLVRSGRQCLSHRAVDVVGDPGASCRFGKLMECVFGKVVLLAQT